MKNFSRLAVIMSAFIFLISACSTTKNVINGGASRARFVGTWTVTDVSYERLVQSAVQNVFDQAPPADFIGSVWQLTNSGNGMYNLNSGASQSIFWSYSGDTFQFKKIYEGDKAKNVTTGYSLQVSANDGQTMVLKTPVAIGNTTGYVVYTFAKK